MKVARLQSKRITDWNSFHDVFSNLMGFSDFYGRNLDAWIDCMTYLDDADSGMTHISAAAGELFHLEIEDTKDFAQRLPEIFQALIECSAFVNSRRIETGDPAVLALIFL